jgi:hypothetical protein
MMKVKLFHGIDIASVEMQINRWLSEEKPRVEKVIQSVCFNPSAKSADIVISIWHEETKKAGFASV